MSGYSSGRLAFYPFSRDFWTPFFGSKHSGCLDFSDAVLAQVPMRFLLKKQPCGRGDVRGTSGKRLCQSQPLKPPPSTFVSLLSSFTRTSGGLHARARRHRRLPPPQRAPGGQCESGRTHGRPMRQRGWGPRPDRCCRRAERPRAPPGGSVGLAVMSGLHSAAHCAPAGYSHTGRLRTFPENMKLLIVASVTVSSF